MYFAMGILQAATLEIGDIHGDECAFFLLDIQVFNEAIQPECIDFHVLGDVSSLDFQAVVLDSEERTHASP